MIYLQSLLALAFVLGLIILLYAAMKRWGDGMVGRKNRKIQVLESISLGEKRQLFLVQVQNQSFLLAAAGRQVSLLGTLEPETEASAEEVPNKTLVPRVLNALQLNEGA